MLSAILFFTSILILGSALVKYFKLGQESSFWGLAYGLGSLVISLQLFLYFIIFRLSFSPWLFWFFGLEIIIALIYCFKKINWQNNFLIPRWELWPTILVILVTVIWLLSFFEAIARPGLAYDTVAFWSLRAKLLIVQGQVDFNPLSETYLNTFSYKNYPWHFSLLEYWFRLLGGKAGWLNLISWGYFVSLTLIIIKTGKRLINKSIGWLMGLAFVSLPLIFYHSFNNYSDLILAYYIVVSFSFLLNWLLNHQAYWLIWSALIGGYTMMIKNDGVFYVIAFIVTYLLIRFLKIINLTSKLFWSTLLTLFMLPAPWLIFKAIYQLGLANVEGNFSWHPNVFYPLYEALFVSYNWNIWWFIFVVFTLILSKKIIKQSKLWPAWLIFVLMTLGIVAMYVFTEHYRWALDHTAISRTLIPLTSMSILLLIYSSHLIFKPHD